MSIEQTIRTGRAARPMSAAQARFVEGSAILEAYKAWLVTHPLASDRDVERRKHSRQPFTDPSFEHVLTNTVSITPTSLDLPDGVWPDGGWSSMWVQHCACGWIGRPSHGMVDAMNGGKAHLRSEWKKWQVAP